MIELRPYQMHALTSLAEGYRRGLRRMVISHPTGTGKTITFATMVNGAVQKRRRTLILAHRDELIQQAQDKILQVAPELAGSIGVVKGPDDNAAMPVTVASVQSLHAKRLERILSENESWDVVVVDECHHCHVTGTTITTPGGDVPIQDVAAGDTVVTWDGNEFVYKPVTHTFRYVYDAPVLEITVEGGARVTVTPNHKLYDGDGRKVRASYLRVGDWLAMPDMRHVRADPLRLATTHTMAPRGVEALPNMQRHLPSHDVPGTQGRPSHGRVGMPCLRRAFCHSKDRRRSPIEPRWASRRRSSGDTRTGDGKAWPKYGVQGVSVAPDGGRKEPYGESGGKGEDARQRHQGSRGWSHGPLRARRRQWWLGNRRRETLRGVVPPVDAFPTCGSWRWRTALSLRTGLRIQGRDGGRRTGWQLTQGPRGSRRAQGRAPSRVGVENLAVANGIQRARITSITVRHYAGHVHDFTVADHHNYIANDILSSNSAASSYTRILEACGCMDEDTKILTLGVTATPQRSDSKDLGDIWQEIVHHMTLIDAMKAGYLCDLRALAVTLDAMDLSDVKVSRGDYVDSQTSAKLLEAEAPLHVCGAWRVHAAERKTLIFTPTIALAHEMAYEFQAHGISAVALSGETPMDERRSILARFSSGEIQVIANAQVLTEGFDEPSITCIVIARPTKSQVLYSQMIGRGTRTYPGKDDCLIIDTVGATNRLDLLTAPKLFGLGEESGETQEKQSILQLALLQEEKQTRQGVVKVREVELFDRKQLNWLAVRPGTWVLKLQGETLELQADQGSGTWMFVTRDTSEGALPNRLIQRTGMTLELAMGVAEEYARRSPGFANTLVSKNAGWRSKPPTEGQLAAAEKWGIRQDLSGLTRGEVNDMIDIVAARKRR